MDIGRIHFVASSDVHHRPKKEVYLEQPILHVSDCTHINNGATSVSIWRHKTVFFGGGCNFFMK